MFRNIPTVTKNLLIINVIVYLASLVFGPVMEKYGALHFFLASDWNPLQFITYQFMHGSFTHLFFNMFALWMFGCVIENVWGPRKFIFYYIACGVFAGFCQEIVQTIQFYFIATSQFPEASLAGVLEIAHNSSEVLNSWLTIGASGAVYAILLAFGMTFPNERIFIFPLPVPIKAKWFVLIYAAIELFSAISSRGDGVAHMAHLGGMLSGFLLILYWRKHPGSHFNLNGSRQFFDRWGGRSRQQGPSRNTGYTINNGHTGFSGNADSTIDMDYNARQKERQEEIDKILDKIRKSGYDSLTKEEKQRLFEASHQR
ncbi:MAG: rhomboid family intramembrane serine protease [Prevotella sp.]|nr:rhomboid family intramembrane serine protease [Prevotella sp.]